jgi:hypothetical protein
MVTIRRNLVVGLLFIAAVCLIGCVPSAYAQTVITIDFTTPTTYVSGSNTLYFYTPDSSSGFLGATYSLYNSSDVLIATTSASADNGFAAVFGPSAAFWLASAGAVVNNVTTLFPHSTSGILMVDAPGTVTLTAVNADISACTSSNCSGFETTATIKSIDVTPAPEPGTAILWLTGIGLMGLVLGKRLLSGHPQTP